MPIILVHLIKFIHLLLTLSILGSVLYCVIAISSKNFEDKRRGTIIRITQVLLVLGFLGAVTGTFLVYPKHFTFHTPWIQAAYVLMTAFMAALGLLILLRKKRGYRFACMLVYLILLVLLIGVVHDAVTKTPFLPFF